MMGTEAEYSQHFRVTQVKGELADSENGKDGNVAPSPQEVKASFDKQGFFILRGLFTPPEVSLLPHPIPLYLPPLLLHLLLQFLIPMTQKKT